MRFQYQALERDGRLVDGLIEAPSERRAHRDLVRRGVRPTRIGLAPAPGGTAPRRRRSLKRRDLSAVVRQLQTLVAGGVPVAEAVTVLTEATDHSALAAAYGELTASLRRGEPFPIAFARCFPQIPTYIHRVTGAQLIIEHCAIYGFGTAGISVATNGTSVLNVSDTYIDNSASGISFAPTGTLVSGTIDHTTIQNMTGAGIASSGSAPINFTITNSVITGTTTGVTAGTASTRFNLDSSSVSNNGTAFNAATSGAYIRISNDDVFDNNTNFAITSGAIVQSFGNNQIGPGFGPSPNASVPLQ